jgi:threonine/homoserine/homoserine lactone efflux protein
MRPARPQHPRNAAGGRTGARPVQCVPAAALLYLPRAAMRAHAAASSSPGTARMVDPVPFMTYTFVMSITPGPNNLMLTASGASFGFRRTLPHLLGIVCGFLVQLLAVCAGLATLFARWPRLQSALAWAGAAYLLYLGWQMLGHKDAEAHAAARPVTFLQAAAFQFLNPKAWMMTVTAATLFLPQELGPLASGGYMAAVMEGIGLPCMAVWALFGSSLRGVIGAPRGRRVFNLAMALALAGTAVMMVR